MVLWYKYYGNYRFRQYATAGVAINYNNLLLQNWLNISQLKHIAYQITS